MVLPDLMLLDYYWMLLFCRARRAMINRPNGIGPCQNSGGNSRCRNKKSPANFAGPFSGPEARA
ncbi:hypothetical protein [Paraburkholderia rhynchosiae]|uniref:hypothetical protein n=1 Tax=Paraburkholderia rhynchosiae TaxID=487049 RepID=UPI0011AF0217|nr:hypothetical protein [Paraburkholderia rhynchosiae]